MKTRINACLAALLFHSLLFSQVTETPANIAEQQLEYITENTGTETEDDAYLQDLQQFKKNPVNLNTVTGEGLSQLGLLTPMQVENFLLYRKALGNLLDIYEMQAVPGWDIHTVMKLRPYITVHSKTGFINGIWGRLQHGDHSFLVRASQVFEKSVGYEKDTSGTANRYNGSPQRVLVRYRYTFKNLLYFGFTGEKDPGEQFFKGRQSAGFDFYSAHLFMRNLGMIKSLAIGDYTVNLGQGLIQWQSLAFKKGALITGIKRQSPVLKPYNSAGEVNFHRGAGITIGSGKWEATVFGSYRNTDANLVPPDSLETASYISSFQTSGYHRTNTELADKAIQKQLVFGGNVSYRLKKLQVGINAIQYRFSLPVIKEADPYNRYALSGKRLSNYSVDYSFTYRNMHLFGEFAGNGVDGRAMLNGMLISVSAQADISLLYRNISRDYQSLNANAFTETAIPKNEAGFYSGISIRPVTNWQIDAYADIYHFPWLKYLVHAPTRGSDYLLQLTYKPNRQLEIFSRFKSESKAANNADDNHTIKPVIANRRKNWRTQVNFKISRHLTYRNRIELSWFNAGAGEPSRGFLANIDLLYKPMLKPFSANIRLQFFQTDDYDSRLYAYENDVLFSNSIPVFFEKGYRYYLNINYDFSRKWSVWARLAQTIYPGKESIGSGLDEIKGKHKTELKIQLMYQF